MTPSTYPEQRFRHRQDGTCHVGAHPNWGGTHLGSSPYTMATDGCLVQCAAYLMSRFYGRDITGGDLVNHLNDVNGFTDASYPAGAGLMKWSEFSKNTQELLVLSSRWDKTYTIRAVIFGKIVHFVVELRGGLAFDPWTGNIVSFQEQFAFGRWKDTSIRRYLKALRKPAT